MSKPAQILREFFITSVNSVQPYNLIKNGVSLTGRHLTVMNRSYILKKPVYVVGFGKAVMGMAVAVEETLGPYLQRGIVSIPEGILKIPKNTKLEYIQGARNNLPDENALSAAITIRDLVKDPGEDDIVVVLISGGGSALLPLAKGLITLSEKLELVKKLGNSGADISEMNCVRKDISELKGGGLANICYPAKVVTLILSDVIGDPLDVIASGPTSVNKYSTQNTIDILKKYSLYDDLPESINNVLNENLKCKNERQGAIKNGEFVHVDNFIIGNNEIAADSILKLSKKMNLQSLLLSTTVSGNVVDISEIYAKIASYFVEFRNSKLSIDALVNNLQKFKPEIGIFNENALLKDIQNFVPDKDICLIMAGEPTVTVTGHGLGGRNQQLALLFSVELAKFRNQLFDDEITFLSCGTDGIDGPTDAAGAIGYSTLTEDCLKENLNPQSFIDNNDCYNFYQNFQNGEYLVKVGHTGTNVMDIHLLLLTKK